MSFNMYRMLQEKRVASKTSRTNSLLRILTAAKEELEEVNLADNELLSNIKGQLSEGFLEGDGSGGEAVGGCDDNIQQCLQNIIENVEKLQSLFSGENEETEEPSPEKLFDRVTNQTDDLKGSIDTAITAVSPEEDQEEGFDHEESEEADEEIEEDVEEDGEEIDAPHQEFRNLRSQETMTPDSGMDLLDVIMSTIEQMLGQTDAPEEVEGEWIDTVYPEETVEEPSMLPDVKHPPKPSAVKGGETWELFKLAGDLSIISNMFKGAEDEHTRYAALTLLDPTDRTNLPDNVLDSVQELYVDIADVDLRVASKKADRLSKVAYFISGYPDKEEAYERMKNTHNLADGYESFLKNVAETHHQAFARLEEQKHPDNEIMPLRLKDGDREHKPRDVNRGFEKRLDDAEAHNTKRDARNNLEKMTRELYDVTESTEKELDNRLDHVDKALDATESRLDATRNPIEVQPEIEMKDMRDKLGRSVSMDTLLERARKTDETKQDREMERVASIFGGVIDEPNNDDKWEQVLGLLDKIESKLDVIIPDGYLDGERITADELGKMSMEGLLGLGGGRELPPSEPPVDMAPAPELEEIPVSDEVEPGPGLNVEEVPDVAVSPAQALSSGNDLSLTDSPVLQQPAEALGWSQHPGNPVVPGALNKRRKPFEEMTPRRLP